MRTNTPTWYRHRRLLGVSVLVVMMPAGVAPQEPSRSAHGLGVAALARGELAAAEQHFTEALTARALLQPGSLAVASTIDQLGVLARTRGDLDKADGYHRRAYEIRERHAPGSLDMAESLNNIGTVAHLRGQLSVSHDYFSRALDIRRRLDPDSLAVAESLNSLGNVAYRRGDLAVARAYYDRSREIRERLVPDSMDVARSLTNLGNVLESVGDLSAALDFHLRAMAIGERLAPGSSSLAVSLQNVGRVAYVRGDLAEAEHYLTRAIALKEKVAPDSISLATSINNLGLVASGRGDFVAARDLLRRALAIRERLAPDSFAVASTLNNLGVVAHALGQHAEAHAYHSRALGIDQRVAPKSLAEAQTLTNLGALAAFHGDRTAAEALHRRALAIREGLAPTSLAVAASLTHLGDLANDGAEPRTAEDFHRRALALRERLAPNSLSLARSLSRLGGLASADRRPDEALELFTRAVTIIESQRWQVPVAETRALMLAGYAETYAGLLRAHLALGDVAAAFAIAERARARSLLDILVEANADIRDGVGSQLIERERRLQLELNRIASQQLREFDVQRTDAQTNSTKTELEALLVQYQQVQAEIRAKSPRYAALTQPQPLTLHEVQQQVIDEGSLLLEYVLGEPSSVVFAVSATSIRAVALPARADIEQAARRVTELVMARQSVPGESVSARHARIVKADAAFADASETLGRMVLGPLSDQLSNQRLVIVADGALQYVPFAAIVARDGQPLIVNHEVVHLPSASVLALQRRELAGRETVTQQVAVVADPVFDPEDARAVRGGEAARRDRVTVSLPADVQDAVRGTGLMNERGTLARLPFTRDEAEAILAVSPPHRSMKALDFDASRATILGDALGRHRVVHLATHGILNTEHPELSGLVLSLVDPRGQRQDGVLRLHEIYNLNWSADLVVLSACQTALGKQIRGEGLVGLTRGFMYAGARSVLASLWNVNDSATAEFMRLFYRGMFLEKLVPAAALRAAQIAMLKRPGHRSPYYWAAFVLQGEWRQ